MWSEDYYNDRAFWAVPTDYPAVVRRDENEMSTYLKVCIALSLPLTPPSAILYSSSPPCIGSGPGDHGVGTRSRGQRQGLAGPQAWSDKSGRAQDLNRHTHVLLLLLLRLLHARCVCLFVCVYVTSLV